MTKKRLMITAVVVVVLALLVYFQFRTWKNFDWQTFWGEWKTVSPVHILLAILLIYISYFLRAVRWKLFLRPVREHASTVGLLPPTVIGFTGLALLGRPGELIRPYLIARRENLSFSSQVAVWAVERIFDIGGFTVLMVLAIFLPTALRSLPNPIIYPRLRVGGVLLIGLVLGMAAVTVITARYGRLLADFIEARFSHLAANLGHRIAHRVREFHSGLNTIHSFASFLGISATSILMWWLIALSYREVTHSFGAPFQHMTVSKVLLLMGSSMLGSLIQLPGVGGGSQLATISALEHIFDAPHELAASCGILLWLATFISVVPLGLAMAHRERLSLRKLSQESAHEEEETAVGSQPPA